MSCDPTETPRQKLEREVRELCARALTFLSADAFLMAALDLEEAAGKLRWEASCRDIPPPRQPEETYRCSDPFP